MLSEVLWEFYAWFWTDADCLEWLRWPTGFICPGCGHTGGWRLGDGRFMCLRCGGRTSVTAGTIFDRTRLEPGARLSGSPVENRRPGVLRLNEYLKAYLWPATPR